MTAARRMGPGIGRIRACGAIVAAIALSGVSSASAQPIAHTNQGRNATPPLVPHSGGGPDLKTPRFERWMGQQVLGDPTADPYDDGSLGTFSFETTYDPHATPAGGPGVIPAPSTALPVIGGGLLLLRRRRRT